MSRKFTIERLELAEANAFVAEHHRHHKRVIGHVFSIGAAQGDKIVGIAIVGRPVARGRDDGVTAEVTRLATDGTKDACSFLYGAAARAAFALGFKRIGTYILASEPGTSLAAAGVAANRRGARPFVVMRVTPARRQAPDAGKAFVRACGIAIADGPLAVETKGE